MLLVETVFDTLNAKAALFAIEQHFEAVGRRWPVMISGTITDASGRTLSGQTAEAFWNSLNHIRPLSFGLNCALGAGELRQYVEELSHLCDCFVSAHPNAGLPNAFGGYDETPEQLAAEIADWARRDSSISSAAAAAPRRTHRRHRRWRCRRQAAPRPAAGEEAAPVRSRTVQRRPRLAVRQRRRADQRHRLAGLRADDSRRPLRRCAGGRPPAGGKRRAGDRHQHGRGDARFEGGDGSLPQADRQRAGHLAGADHDRLVEMGGHRGRPQVHPGQGHRQLDLDEGRRGRVPAPGQAGAPLRCGGRGDGLRRGRAGRHLRPQDRDLRPRLPACSPSRRLSRPRTSSSTRTSSPSPPASKSTTTMPSTSSRPVPGFAPGLPGAQISGGVSNVSFSFRGNDPVREAIHTVFLYHAITGRVVDGHRQRRHARRL
jgi:hypothetical protein